MSAEPLHGVQVATQSRTGNAHKTAMIVGECESKNVSG